MPPLAAKVVFSAIGRVKDGAFHPAAHGRITVTLFDTNDQLLTRFDVAPNSPRSRTAVTRQSPMTDPEVIEACDGATKGTPVTWVAKPEVAAPLDHVTLTIRGFTEATGKDTTGPTLATLKSLLPGVPNDTLLCWKGTDALTCLDIDYHEAKPPLRTHLETWVETRVSPKPVAWHFSRGGGLHLFYVAADGYTASELSSAAAIRFRMLDPTAGLEPKKTQVRGPGDETVRWLTPDTGGVWCGSGEDVDEAAIEEYLATHGMELGARYPHDKCPIDPTEGAERDPVTVSPLGIYCHRCSGKGYSFGSRRPGFAPWSALTGAPSGGDVGQMVANLSHWGHAKWVLTQKYELPEDVAREGYSAALRQHHGEAYTDRHKALVFSKDTADFCRSRDRWMNLESGYTYPNNGILPLLGTLPSVQVETEKGLKPAGSSVAYMLQGHDLTGRGYGDIQVVHGFRMARQFLPPAKHTMVSILPKELRGSPRAPKYVPKSQRMPMSEAEGIFHDGGRFPGLDMNAVRLLVCASAVAQETRLGLHPLVFLCGHTAAGKTTTTKIAAGIVGTAAPEITFTTNEERLKQSIVHATDTGSLACANEFLKDSYRLTRRIDPRAALEPFLTITPESQNHVMFLGPRRLGKLPALIITEPGCPPAVREYHQLSRRFRYIRLHGETTRWLPNMASLGLAPDCIHLYRERDGLLATAADAIMSDLIDRYFSYPMSWDDIANDLGVPTILKSDAFEDDHGMLRRFFDLVAQAPEINDPRLKRLYSEGYKVIHRTDTPTELDQELCDLWTMYVDPGYNGWVNSQLLVEKNWSEILKVPGVVTLDIKSRGANMVLVRFRIGPPKNPLRINGAILEIANGG